MFTDGKMAKGQMGIYLTLNLRKTERQHVSAIRSCAKPQKQYFQAFPVII